MPPNHESLPPELVAAIERLAEVRGWTFDQAVDELVIEGIAMGGLSQAGRPKAKLILMCPPPISVERRLFEGRKKGEKEAITHEH